MILTRKIGTVYYTIGTFHHFRFMTLIFAGTLKVEVFFMSLPYKSLYVLPAAHVFYFTLNHQTLFILNTDSGNACVLRVIDRTHKLNCNTLHK